MSKVRSGTDEHLRSAMDDLLLITPGFPRDEADDGCIPPMQAYLRRYMELHPGASVRVIATQYPFHQRPYTWHGVEVYPCGGANRRWAKPLAWRRALRTADRLHRQYPVQRVHSLWLGECAWIGQRVAARTGASHVATLQGQDARDEHGWWRMVAKGRSSFVALSERHAAMFRGMTAREPDAIIPWGIDPRAAAPSAERDIDVLFAGSLIPLKRPAELVEILRRVAQIRPVKAVIAGARIPAHDRTIDELVERTMPKGVVTVLGEVPRAEMMRLMARSRVLVHPSAYESQGYVFSEALLHGMCIVSRAVGIATPGPRWRLAGSGEEAVTCLLELLGSWEPRPSVFPHDVTATVEAYDALFKHTSRT
jgi:glycosyltransferase involved in cell wall biosynthesis